MTRSTTLELQDETHIYAGRLKAPKLVAEVRHHYRKHTPYHVPVKGSAQQLADSTLVLDTKVPVTIDGPGLSEPQRVKPTPDSPAEPTPTPTTDPTPADPTRVKPTPDDVPQQVG